ncbi:hypothetical protein HK105_202759 [Polyrhizophydium stewartii]|uniref:GH16 domain-containing protein n=1 Tax=Polyrhizophydium stewartii TaxID=2732419 RepID=A0ABR4N2A2_9FUNG
MPLDKPHRMPHRIPPHTPSRGRSLRVAAAAAVVAAAMHAQAVAAEPHTTLPQRFSTGDCVTQRLRFDAGRVFDLAGTDSRRFTVDRTQFDFTKDYGAVAIAQGTAVLSLVGSSATPAGGALGARLSTTRYMLYGRITARLTPAVDPGVVSTFITWSDFQNTLPSGEIIQDEIDWEIVGKNPAKPETNLFTGKASDYERNSHGGPIAGNITVGEPHDFFIDWKPDRIEWGVDGVVHRTQLKSQSVAADPSHLPPGAFWFSETPSRVQLSVWDGSGGAQQVWAGGPIAWGDRPQISVPFEWVDIQCYDSAGSPVPRWAADGSGPTAETGAGKASTTGASNSVWRSARHGHWSAPAAALLGCAAAVLAL